MRDPIITADMDTKRPPSREEFFLQLVFDPRSADSAAPQGYYPASLWRFVIHFESHIGPGLESTLEMNWHGHTQRYVCDYRARSTPQSIERILLALKPVAAAFGLPPLVIVPFLSEERLIRLERDGVSGIDLSGNGVLLAPEFCIWRSGQPNRFPEAQPIRNIYRGNSSLFARCFLLRGEFPTLSSLRDYAQRRLSPEENDPTTKKMTIGTASKVVKALEEDLIVRTSDNRLTLIDGDALLERLQANYRPSSKVRVEGKTPLTPEQVWQRLAQAGRDYDAVPNPTRLNYAPDLDKWKRTPQRSLFRYVTTGLGSAAKYRVLSGPDKLSLYVPNLAAVADLIELRETHVFPNVELIEEKDDPVYFDARREDGAVWASPIQTWIELATDGPREREAAQSLRSPLAQSHGAAL